MLVAHRGYAQKYPENTLLALNAAVDAGAQFIEFDIQLSKDAIPFLIHDDNLYRTGGLDLSVFEMTISELENTTAGEPDRFGDQYASEMPIGLEAICDQLNQWHSVHSFIEIKEESADHFGVEQVVEAVLEAIATLRSRHTLISFSEEVVASVKKNSSKSVGWVISKWNEPSLQTLEALSPDFVFCNYKKIPEHQPLPSFGGKWVLYDFDDPTLASKWLSKGADLVETMAVGPMIEAMYPEVRA